MSIIEMQRVLARVVTDDAFREVFLSDPERACSAFDLNERERQSLKALNMERVGSYAIIVRDGRVGLGLKAFPLTHGLLPRDFARHIARYAREFPPAARPGSTMYHEAMMLSEFILRLIDEGELGHRYLRDVLEYEKILFAVGNRLDASLSAQTFADANASRPAALDEDAVGRLRPARGQHAEVGSFAYDMVELVARLGRGEEPDLPEVATHLLFYKAAGQQGVKTRKINAATRDLIELCDGRRTTAEVFSELAARCGLVSAEGRAELSRRGLKMLEALAGVNVIRFTD